MSDLRFLIIHDTERSEEPLSDNGEAIDGVKSFLSSKDHDVVEVRNVEKGLELVRSDGFYVVMIDITMPGANGVEALKEIVNTKAPEWIIVFTDEQTKALAIREVGTELCAYLKKPVDSNELKVLIDNILLIFSLRQEISGKTKSVSQLKVLNEISREALLSRDKETMLWKIARLINEELLYFNVNIFLMDKQENRVVLNAFAGGFGEDLVAGFSLKPGEGIVGWIAENRKPLIAGDVRNEPIRIRGFSFEEDILSELGVPIIFNGKVHGVLHVESKELNAFTHDDIMVLETVADQMALSFEKSRLSNDLLDAFNLSSTINDSLPVSIALVDQSLQIKYANQTFYDSVNTAREHVLNKPVFDIFSGDLAQKLNLNQQLIDVFETGIPVSHTNVHHVTEYHAEKALNISFIRVQAGEKPLVMILGEDVTEFFHKTEQLSRLREISIAMQGVFERDKLLHMILTSVTAGFAMGFNRAFLFLVDKTTGKLNGIMGVGPTSREEAYKIWGELSQRSFTFHDYMEDMETDKAINSGLQETVEQISFDLKEDRNVLTETVNSSEPIHIVDAWENPNVDEKMKKTLASSEFVTIPLIAKGEVIGILLADNAFSGRLITKESIEELNMFAAPAALAIEKANILKDLEVKVEELEYAYQELAKTHDMLIRHEKLAAIGEVSTRLAHEIRNPLATIGGFAKSIPRKYEDRERTIRNANIIISEVSRLENILTNVLDFTKANTPKKTLVDVNELLRDTIKIAEGNAIKNNVIISLELSEKKLALKLDETQIKQVFINVIQNAFNAMRDGGALGIKTYESMDGIWIEIHDTGSGISEEFLDNIFDPFFTTRGDGTGLGLSISQRIIHNHNGKLEIESNVGAGTTVSILLPVNT
jgi:signal transduction histidine kinase/DNA-binding NarL/FixJ family response regulator